MRVAAVVEAAGDPPGTLGGQIGKQIDHLALLAASINQAFNRIAPCPAAFAADDTQTAKPGTKIIKRDSAVTRHRVTSEACLWSVRDCYGSSATLSRIIILSVHSLL